MKFHGKILILLFVILVPHISTKEVTKKSPDIAMNSYFLMQDLYRIRRELEKHYVQKQLEFELKRMEWPKESSKNTKELEQDFYLRLG